MHGLGVAGLMFFIMTSQELLRWAVSLIGSGSIGGVAGALITAGLTTRREKRQRRHEFIERQLRDFYSPILGLRIENQAICVSQGKISGTANEAWRAECAELRQSAKAEENLERFSAQRGPVFAAITDYNNKQMAQVNANYRRMVAIFRENLWLAKPETRDFFGAVLEYSDLSERWTAGTIPREVLVRLEHSERVLIPFFEHVQETHDLLRARLKMGG